MKNLNTHASVLFVKPFTILTILVLVLWLGSSAAAGPPNDPRVYGKTYGEWGALWWQWISEIPESINPVRSFGEVDCTLGQRGSVWFLALPPDERAVSRSCTIPRGKALFFPLFSNLIFNCCGAPSLTVGEKRQALAELLDGDDPVSACRLVSTLDGEKTVFVTPTVRTQTPPFLVRLIEDNLFGAPAGEFDASSIADGIWVMLQPLTPGNHVVHFEAAICDHDTNILFSDVNVTYNLLVN